MQNLKEEIQEIKYKIKEKTLRNKYTQEKSSKILEKLNNQAKINGNIKKRINKINEDLLS